MMFILLWFWWYLLAQVIQLIHECLDTLFVLIDMPNHELFLRPLSLATSACALHVSLSANISLLCLRLLRIAGRRWLRWGSSTAFLRWWRWCAVATHGDEDSKLRVSRNSEGLWVRLSSESFGFNVRKMKRLRWKWFEWFDSWEWFSLLFIVPKEIRTNGWSNMTVVAPRITVLLWIFV